MLASNHTANYSCASNITKSSTVHNVTKKKNHNPRHPQFYICWQGIYMKPISNTVVLTRQNIMGTSTVRPKFLGALAISS